MHSRSSAFALSLEAISKRFGDVRALADVSLRVRHGSIHALLGENGAGKTTLMRIAFGLITPDAGTIRVNERSIPHGDPRLAIAAGVGMVHQHFSLVPAFTVTENVAMGGRGLFKKERVQNMITSLSSRVRLAISPNARVDQLSVSAQQRVEIVRVLAREAEVLILDEPTAVLAPTETTELLEFLRQFANGGGSVVLITHKLRDALAVAHDLTVLRRGRVMFTGQTHGVQERDLVVAMLGTEILERAELASAGVTRTRFDAKLVDAKLVADTALGHHTVRIASLDRVTSMDTNGVTRLSTTSFDVFQGEIVGVAGVEGSGHAELLRIIAGRLQPTTGSVTLPHHIGFIPADRRRDALIADFTLTENVALHDLSRQSGFISWQWFQEKTETLIQQFDIRPTNPRIPAGALSGGNQQKLVVAREIADSPPLIVAENPTRGLDIQAAGAIRSKLLGTTKNGAAVLWYSSDLDELLSVASRVVVVYAGQLYEAPLDRDEIGRRMIGATLPT